MYFSKQSTPIKLHSSLPQKAKHLTKGQTYAKLQI